MTIGENNQKIVKIIDKSTVQLNEDSEFNSSCLSPIVFRFNSIGFSLISPFRNIFLHGKLSKILMSFNINDIINLRLKVLSIECNNLLITPYSMLCQSNPNNYAIEFNLLFEKINNNIYSIESLYFNSSNYTINMDLSLLSYINEIVYTLKDILKNITRRRNNLKKFNNKNNFNTNTKISSEGSIIIIKNMIVKPISVIYSHINPPNNDDNDPILIRVVGNINKVEYKSKEIEIHSYILLNNKNKNNNTMNVITNSFKPSKSSLFFSIISSIGLFGNIKRFIHLPHLEVNGDNISTIRYLFRFFKLFNKTIYQGICHTLYDILHSWTNIIHITFQYPFYVKLPSGLPSGIQTALQNLFVSPYYGICNGLFGFVRGIQSGVTGLFIYPTLGVFRFFIKHLYKYSVVNGSNVFTKNKSNYHSIPLLLYSDDDERVNESEGEYLLQILQGHVPNQEIYVCSLYSDEKYYILTSNHLLIINNTLTFPKIELIIHLNETISCSINRNSVKIILNSHDIKKNNKMSCGYIFCNKYRNRCLIDENTKEIEIKLENEDGDVFFEAIQKYIFNKNERSIRHRRRDSIASPLVLHSFFSDYK